MSARGRGGRRGGQPPPPCKHQGDAVRIGEHVIYAGGGNYLWPELVADYDLRVFLRAEASRSSEFGRQARGCLWLPIEDFKTVPEAHWETWIKSLEIVRSTVEGGQRVLVFCAGGHGRTGLFLASLLALMEPGVNDPVREIRRRYCEKAVETMDQYHQVMKLLNHVRSVAAN